MALAAAGVVVLIRSGIGAHPYALVARAGVAGVISLLVLSHDLHGSRSLLRASAEIRAASDRFDRTGVQDQISIHPLPAHALAIRRALAARGLPH